MKSVTGIQATLAHTERHREREKEREREREKELLARAPSRGRDLFLYSFVAIGPAPIILDQTTQDNEPGNIPGIEWTIMRLHLNNLSTVDFGSIWGGRALSLSLSLSLFLSECFTFRLDLAISWYVIRRGRLFIGWLDDFSFNEC